MKKIFSLIVCLIFMLSSSGQSIEGSWNGKLDLGSNKLTIVFNINKSENGYSGTMVSPDQSSQTIPLTSVKFENDNLTAEVKNLGVLYNATLEGDSILNGTFRQSGLSIPLKLTKGEVKLNRPQEPKPPFPYHSEDVVFDNTSTGITLAGTLTMPDKSGKYPALILVSGSGPQDRNEEILGHKPFLVIADHLTKNGIAVLRYDDRGFGKSTGNFATATTEDFMTDALSAFEYLSQRPEIDKNKIGIIGHSEGGMICFMAAARNKNIAFVITLAGPGVKGDSLLVTQNRDILLLDGLQPEVVDIYCSALSKTFAVLQNSSNEDIVKNTGKFALGVLSESDATKLPGGLKSNLHTILITPVNPWYKHWYSYDPVSDIKNTECAVFALNGGKDCQVNADINLSAIEKNLKAGGNNKFIIKKYDNLNHLFQNANTGSALEYKQIEETVSPEVLDDIKNWISSIIK